MATPKRPKVGTPGVDEQGRQQLPSSGERVSVPPARSTYNKPPGALTPDEKSDRSRARNVRKNWEKSDVGQARTTGFSQDQLRQANVSQIHHMDNYDTKEDVGPRLYDTQLPGMADPDAAPRPPQWHELSDAQRAHTERALARHGTSMEQVQKDLGSQIDQAHVRSQSHGHDDPYASRFYESGEPRKRIDQSAKELGISPLIHAQMNAFTSPNTKFSINRANGTTSYPNDEAARHVVMHIQRGGSPEKITNKTDKTLQLNPATLTAKEKAAGKKPDKFGRVQGYVTNMRKAARAMSQHQKGVAPADWQLGSGGEGGFEGSPKTGPYANSWSDTHPQFTVSDVHTGGGGAFPHLGSEKPLINPEDDSRGKRSKSERERALERVPYVHSAIDHAMRGAMVERNLGSVRRSQATQWGEEQLQRGEAGLRGAPKPEEVYADRRSKSQFHQESLF
jgi:hypothetical protein